MYILYIDYSNFFLISNDFTPPPGGFIPAERRGKKFEGIVNVADWYGTLTELAGVDMEDSKRPGSWCVLRNPKNPWKRFFELQLGIHL